MTDMIRSFNELAASQQSCAGGKGGTLARLYQAGYPVPDGFVILPATFTGDELSPEAWLQIQAHLQRIRKADKETAFAVRSSALSEDSAQASFAGEFETVLDVWSDEAIQEAIYTVRQSRQSARVQSYSRAQGMDANHKVAVVVQRMIPASISGVLFTADPVSGSRMKMVGNFVHGLGEQLVSGGATGETFTIERPQGQYQGPAELKGHARRLYKLAGRLEKELGCPQDIEWAIAGGKLFLLQSRPITTLQGYNPASGEWNHSLSGDYLWSNVNFGEAVSGVMTPLTWTVLQLIFGAWMTLPGYNVAGNIGGRPYLNISIFASVFHAMGKNSHDLLEALEGTLYMRLPPEMEIPLLPLSRWSLLSILPNLIGMRMKEKRGVKALPAYLAANPAWCKGMRQQIHRVETKAGLISLWREEISPHVRQSVWAVMGSVSHYVDYTTKLRRELTELVGPDDADALISNLSYGSGHSDNSGASGGLDLDDGSSLLASLGPVVGLARVARGQMDREAYLGLYGHRGPHEFELSLPRPAEDPDWLDQQLSQFSKSPVDVEALLANKRAGFDAAWKRFQKRYPRKAKSMRRRIDRIAPRARRREAARSEYTRDRWVVRAFALRAGELTGLGDDIFFLTIDELLDLLSGAETAINFIPARQETYERYSTLPPYPSIIRGRFDPFRWAADPERRSDFFDSHAPLPVVASDDGGSNLIFGSPGAAGRVEGLVRRLDRAEDGDQLQGGEVLVTGQTDIAWTLLFPRAAAVVTDVGAPLSHAAIVARELGIPAVVGCADATMRLKTGDRVRVDGGRGVVEIIAEVRSQKAEG